jgi:large subunit ribosomal protein L10
MPLRPAREGFYFCPRKRENFRKGGESVPTPKKVQEVEEITELLKGSSLTILTNYRGLSVQQFQEFRKTLRESDASFRVVKNTLTGIAADNAGLTDVREFLEGPTAIVTAGEDPVAPAKATQDFVRRSRILEVKAGIFEGIVIPASEIERLATMPSREELLAKVVGGLNAPLYGLVGVLSGPIRALAYVLQARQEQLGGEEGSA